MNQAATKRISAPIISITHAKDIQAKKDMRPYDLYIKTDALEKAWPQNTLGKQLGPTLASLEISLKVLSETLTDLDKRTYVHQQRKIASIIDAICLQFETIAQVNLESIPQQIFTTSPSNSSLFEHVCSQLRDNARDRPHFRYLENRLCNAFQQTNLSLGFNLGLTEDVHFRDKILAYDALLHPVKIHQLHTHEECHAENALYVRTHQACEGILQTFIEQLALAKNLLEHQRWSLAALQLVRSQTAIQAFEATLGILSEMVPVDYAPLRMALRDVCGTQSERVQARVALVKHLYNDYSEMLTQQSLDPFIVFYNPKQYEEEFIVLDAFRSLAHHVHSSMLHHARIVDTTLGYTVYDSLSSNAASSPELIARPLLPEMTNALKQVSRMLAMDYATQSGVATQASETQSGLKKYDIEYPKQACDPKLMQETLDLQFYALQNHDMQTWVQCFAPSCYVAVPVGTKPYLNRTELELIFKNFEQLFPLVHEIQYKVVKETKNSLEIEWAITAETFFDKEITTTYVEQEWHFNPQGQCMVSLAKWQPADTTNVLVKRHMKKLKKPYQH